MRAPRVFEPVPELSFNEPAHRLIERDNLQVMVSLRSQYQGAVDVAYLDPPYNTGKHDFAYLDRRFDKAAGYEGPTLPRTAFWDLSTTRLAGDRMLTAVLCRASRACDRRVRRRLQAGLSSRGRRRLGTARGLDDVVESAGPRSATLRGSRGSASCWCVALAAGRDGP